MKFDLVAWITNPFVLMFIAVFTGLVFGKVRFGKFSFGISGTLFTGLVIGWWVFRFGIGIQESQEGYSIAKSMIENGIIPKLFLNLFLILFVAAVGLLASKDMGVVLKKYGFKFVLLGLIITFVGAATTYGMTFLSADTNTYEVSGVYTGALTSSPGLAAAIETAREHATNKVNKFYELNEGDKMQVLKELNITNELVDSKNILLTQQYKEQYVNNAEAGIGVGYAISYPFGVLIVILAMNFFPKIFKIDVKEEMKIYKKEMEEARKQLGVTSFETNSFDLIGFIVACLLGYTLGKIKIYLGPVGFFSLGSTGGVLIVSLLLGYIGKIGFINFRMNSKVLSVIRQLSLAFFLAIVGLRYGYKVFDALFGSGAYLALVGLLVGLVAMLAGFIIGRHVFKINWIILSGAICGGMTSTPGLGAAINAIGSDEPAAGYGATYPFALFGMVIFTIILHRLPI